MSKLSVFFVIFVVIFFVKLILEFSFVFIVVFFEEYIRYIKYYYNEKYVNLSLDFIFKIFYFFWKI